MESEALSIGELADAAGLTRRAIRFYVQQKLLPPPLGRGRGNHYDARHLSRLRRVIALQQAGHSLDAIRQVVSREPETDPRTEPGSEPGSQPGPALGRVERDESDDGAAFLDPSHTMGGTNGSVDRHSEPAGFAKPQAAALSARLWTRLILADGVELSFDATKFNPTIEDLLRIRQFVRETLKP